MDNQKIREHVQKVSEALSTIATTSGYKRFDATERLEQNAEAWLEQSIEIIEQQQREIERANLQIKLLEQVTESTRFMIEENVRLRSVMDFASDLLPHDHKAYRMLQDAISASKEASNG